MERLLLKIDFRKTLFATFVLTVLLVGMLFVCGCSRKQHKTQRPMVPSANATSDLPEGTSTAVAVPTPTTSPEELEYTAKTQEELEKLAGLPYCVKIIVENDIVLDKEVVFGRPALIAVKGNLKSKGGGIVVEYSGAGRTVVDVDLDVNVVDDAIKVMCPEGELLWRGNCTPSLEFVKKYMNVKTYNGAAGIDDKLGGNVNPEIREAGLVRNEEKISGVIFKTEGNVITVEIPFAMKESVVNNAKFYGLAEGFETGSLMTETGEAASQISLRENYYVTFSNENGRRGYLVKFRRQANSLPMVSLYTDGGAAITSKHEYVHGNLFIDCSGAEEYAEYELFDCGLNVKGRGNASWRFTDKKSYRLKFDEKVSVLGIAPDKDWVLVPNYFDKSLIRNAVAHKMATVLDHLYYTPEHVMVDFFLNGEYRGVYSVCDKIEASDEKIDLGNTSVSEEVTAPGFLIEIGWDFDQENVYGKDFFDTKTIVRLFVKEPEITERHNAEMRYIMSYVNKVDKAIAEGGDYGEYVDMDALVDWFILAELTNNTEMAFYRSCYMYKPENGKLIMGPVWDFDMAFGNHRGDIWNYDGWATAEATYDYVNDTWATYLIKDPEFMALVKQRWAEKRDVLLKTAFDAIDEYSAKVSLSQQENFKVWDILHKQIGEGKVDYSRYNTYELQVQYIKEFLTARALWIDNELSLQS